MVFLSLRPELASAGLEPKQVVVAVIDQGVDFSHPVLSSSQWFNTLEIPNNKIDDDKNGYTDDFGGYNFFEHNSNLMPQGSHATKLAGLIVTGGKMSETNVPVNSGVKIMSLTVCIDSWGCSESSIIDSIYYAVNNGANVINLSLGDTTGYSKAYDSAIKYAYKKGVVVVAAAGNAVNGVNLRIKPLSPVCNDLGQNMVLGVSSADEKGDLPVWANHGNCIDASVNGIDVFTTFRPSEGFFGKAQGTSFSAAIVSGKVASFLQSNPLSSPSVVMDSVKNSTGGQNKILAGEIVQLKALPVSVSKKTTPAKFSKTQASQTKKSVLVIR